MPEPTAICGICDPPRHVEIGALVDHFRIVHDQIVDVERWPDGDAVVIDDTLDPEDFLP